MTALRLGTRRSALARTQSEHVASALRAVTGRDVELVDVVTAGDTSTASLSTIGGTGVFATALREALAAGRVDLAVHSLKDLPTAPAPGLVVAATPPREDPRDVLVARDRLPLGRLAGSRVGTGSPRRAAQLRALGLDLDVVDIRGNVDTRLRMVAEGDLDAVVLARAGLVRVGRADEASEVLDPAVMLPAAGQGALAVECRTDDADTVAACALLDDASTRACVTAERSLLAALEAGCIAPVGALAQDAGGVLTLTAVVAATDGSSAVRRSARGAAGDPALLGRSLAAEMLALGAGDLVGAARPLPVTVPPTPLQTHTPEHDATAATTAWRVEK